MAITATPDRGFSGVLATLIDLLRRQSLGHSTMSILKTSPSFSVPSPSNLSSSRALCGPNHLFLVPQLSRLSISTLRTTTIWMGGGPRTYPGGVSKWQWKRMQAKKAKQLLKARLTRERQIYEMRKRAELRTAVSELERPWEVVEKAPTLFSVSADEQVKVLADRFQKPGGFDLWSERDGPQLFDTVDRVPSARFFPKGVVHSIKPYGQPDNNLDGTHELQHNVSQRDGSGIKSSRRLRSGSCSEGEVESKNSMESSAKISNGRFRKKRNRRRIGAESLNNSSRENQLGRDGTSRASNNANPATVYDMGLQQDGSYGFQAEN